MMSAKRSCLTANDLNSELSPTQTSVLSLLRSSNNKHKKHPSGIPSHPSKPTTTTSTAIAIAMQTTERFVSDLKHELEDHYKAQDAKDGDEDLETILAREMKTSSSESDTDWLQSIPTPSPRVVAFSPLLDAITATSSVVRISKEQRAYLVSLPLSVTNEMMKTLDWLKHQK
jgi:hypothetical protein